MYIIYASYIYTCSLELFICNSVSLKWRTIFGGFEQGKNIWVSSNDLKKIGCVGMLFVVFLFCKKK